MADSIDVVLDRSKILSGYHGGNISESPLGAKKEPETTPFHGNLFNYFFLWQIQPNTLNDLVLVVLKQFTVLVLGAAVKVVP